MSILLAVILIFLALLVHEIGHAGAIHSRGVFVQEIGLGIHHKKIPSFSFTLKKFFPGTIFRLSPLLIGAFVKHDDQDEKWKNFTFSDKAAVFGAGILANLILAVFLYTAWILILAATNPIGLLHPFIWTQLLASLSVAGVIWFGRRLIYPIIPLIGSCVFAFLVFILWGMENPSSGLGGPITIGILTPQYSQTLSEAIFWGAIISLSLALTNAIPFYFLDGGQTMNLFAERLLGNNNLVSKIFRVASKAGFFSLIGVCLVFDIVHLVELFLKT